MEFRVQQSMSRDPMTVSHNENLSAAFLKMRREGFRHMPVTDEAGSIVGLISDRDFQRAMWPINAIDAHGFPNTPHFRKDAVVAEYMSWPVKSIDETTSVKVAVDAMIEQKISALVVTRDDQMVGIVTHEDLLRVLADLLKEPATIKERALHLVQSTPIGKVTEMLAAAGI